MSSLNSGLYSTGRVLRSLGISKQAPGFTLKMSGSGVPWAGIVMTSVVFVFGAVLNALTPTRSRSRWRPPRSGWCSPGATIFAVPAAAAAAVERGVIPREHVPGCPAHPWTSYHRAGLPGAGPGRAWPSRGGSRSPYFWHKTDFIVVVIGIPVIAVLLESAG